MTSYGIKLRVPIYEADGITIAMILCQRNGHHIGLFLKRDSDGKDPKRPRYFTGCVYTAPATNSGRFGARIAELGDDLYNLTFSGKAVVASWRTIYVVPTASDLDSVSSTTPNLMINCNPASHFRIPRWLVARFVALQFYVEQSMNTTTLQVIKLIHSKDCDIILSLGACTEHHDDDPDPSRPVQLWAKVDVVPYGDLDTFPHDCSEEHLDSASWTMRAKVFGDAERQVRLTLSPSTLARKPSSDVFVIHLELLGRSFDKMLQDAGDSSLFPSAGDLETRRETAAPRIDPAFKLLSLSRPRAHSQTDSEPIASPLTPSPPSSRAPSSTSTASSHSRPSRIPRLVSRGPPNAREQAADYPARELL